jgi:hypothetical protein
LQVSLVRRLPGSQYGQNGEACRLQRRNKLKLVKRMMYGIAKIDLLEARLIGTMT